MEVIPAIDIRGGRCVRLFQGDYGRETVFSEDPPAMARHWCALGAPRLHVVDLDGAAEGLPGNREVIRAIITAAAPVPVQVGGGIRSIESVAEVLQWGADRVVLGTAAVTDRDLIAAVCQAFPGRLLVALDARDGKVAIRGWREDSGVSAATLAAEMEALGVPRFLYTDIARDGTETEPHYAALSLMVQATSRPVIASGGVAHAGQVTRLRELGAEGAIIGRALYSGALDLRDALKAAEG